VLVALKRLPIKQPLLVQSV